MQTGGRLDRVRAHVSRRLGRLGFAVVHGHDIHAGNVHAVAERRAEHAQAFAREAGGQHGKRIPNVKQPIRATGLRL